jgi:hypothetical protein
MYIYAPALECAAPTVFMVWQRAWFFKVREWFMPAGAGLSIIHASDWETKIARMSHKYKDSEKKATIRRI